MRSSRLPRQLRLRQFWRPVVRFPTPALALALAPALALVLVLVLVLALLRWQ